MIKYLTLLILCATTSLGQAIKDVVIPQRDSATTFEAITVPGGANLGKALGFSAIDGTLTALDLLTGDISTDTLWNAAGDLAVGTGSNTANRLGIGTALQVLRVNAGATGLEWAAPGSGTGDMATDTLWNAAGDLAVGTGADTATRLGKGTALQVLRVNSGATALEWATPAASTGDMATDTLWDAAGDIAVGTGSNTGTRLAKGTALQILRVNSGGTALEWAANDAAITDGDKGDVIVSGTGATWLIDPGPTAALGATTALIAGNTYTGAISTRAFTISTASSFERSRIRFVGTAAAQTTITWPSNIVRQVGASGYEATTVFEIGNVEFDLYSDGVDWYLADSSSTGTGGSVATDTLWDATGDLAVGSGANTAAKLAKGTALQVLRVNSGATALEWATPSAGSVATDTLWDAAGDLAVGSGADTAAKLVKGTALQVLRVNAGATALEWATPAGSVVTDTVWDAAGDLAVGSGADTAAKLAIGTALQYLRVNSGATALEWAAPSSGYTLMTTYSNSSLAWSDSTSYYYGVSNGAVAADAAGYLTQEIEVPKTGTVTRIWVKVTTTIPGTTEDLTVVLRLNNTTDFGSVLIDSDAATQHAVDSTVSQAVTAGDYLAVKLTTPAWATNPTGRLTCMIYIE